ncbi:MAG TPA: NUDIX hydrolase [Actinomycetales bacterium]|nr:NUDIX hydrolase [Actinomycetales bacterium]
MNEVRRLAARLVYENDVVRVFDDDVAFASGRVGRHVRIETTAPGEGVVLVVQDGGRTALVETFRYPLGAPQLALPRGFGHGPDVVASARAEALEELGVRLGEVKVLGHVTPDSGLQAGRVAVVTARVAEHLPGGTRDHDEVSAVQWLTPDELQSRIAAGRVEDGFTLAALALEHARQAGTGAAAPRRPTS